MKLKLERKYKKEKYTIGNLFIDGVFFCNVIEDTDRGLTENSTALEIADKKIYGETAIPTGTYKIAMDIYSPKFSKYPFYQDICDGRLPRLLNVKGFNGILIHCADGPRGAELVQGCIGIGWNTIKGGLTGGRQVFKDLYRILEEADDEIYIEIE